MQNNLTTFDRNKFIPYSIGFDNLFDRLFDIDLESSNSYPPYNISKVDDNNYIIEMALAHSTHSATEAAYARGDMLLKRRRLMEDWAQFLTVPEREIEDLIEIRADRKEWL